MKQQYVKILCFLSFMLCFLGTGVFATGLDIARMSKEQLKEKLGNSNVIIVDARSGRDWKSSEFKIMGAIRPGRDIVKWAGSYSKDNVFVLYCA